jgi:hypothetical protein
MGMSSKDLSRLGPAAQQQVLQKLGKQQRGREERRSTQTNTTPTQPMSECLTVQCTGSPARKRQVALESFTFCRKQE